jgi:hypothetical protein
LNRSQWAPKSGKLAPTFPERSDHRGIRIQDRKLVGFWTQPWALLFVSQSSNAWATKSLIG